MNYPRSSLTSAHIAHQTKANVKGAVWKYFGEMPSTLSRHAKDLLLYLHCCSNSDMLMSKASVAASSWLRCDRSCFEFHDAVVNGATLRLPGIKVVPDTT